jgi:DNA-binding IclR family transcriptional regulator
MPTKNGVVSDLSARRVDDLFVGDSDDASESGRTVLGRIAVIMRAFDNGDHTLSLIDLSQRAKLPKSTVHRLAEQLRTLGWLERDYNGYRIGMRLFELGCLAIQPGQLRDSAFPHLCALASKTGLPAQLAILDGGDVVYLERVLVDGAGLPTRLGGRMPAHCTALGKAMLAFDASTAEQVMTTQLRRLTRHTITEPDALRSNLARVRASGVAFDVKESYEEIGCVAAPIRNSGRAIGAVSVTGQVSHIDWESATEAVRDSASRIWNARFAPAREMRVETSLVCGPRRPRHSVARAVEAS